MNLGFKVNDRELEDVVFRPPVLKLHSLRYQPLAKHVGPGDFEELSDDDVLVRVIPGQHSVSESESESESGNSECVAELSELDMKVEEEEGSALLAPGDTLEAMQDWIESVGGAVDLGMIRRRDAELAKKYQRDVEQGLIGEEKLDECVDLSDDEDGMEHEAKCE
eukprot:gene207-9_t